MPNYHNESDKPFNDAMDHLNKIEGYPISKGGNLPLPIKIIGYFMFGGMIKMILFGLILSIFNSWALISSKDCAFFFYKCEI